MYQKFEESRVNKAKAIVGDKEIRPDSFCKFIVDRTDFCPHELVSPNSNYWMEVVSSFDGEMGLTLPDKATEIPALFFDALSIVRSERAKVNKEDMK